MNDFLSRIEKWWAQPFNPQGDVISWALFLGLLIVIAFAWTHVLKIISPSIETTGE